MARDKKAVALKPGASVMPPPDASAAGSIYSTLRATVTGKLCHSWIWLEAHVPHSAETRRPDTENEDQSEILESWDEC